MDGDLDRSAVVDMGAYEFQVLEVSIDIKPGSNINPINLKSRGYTLVAILTSDEFNASNVDPSSVRVAGAAPGFSRRWDADWDCDVDLILLFRTQDFVITPACTQIQLIGLTYDHQLITGTDKIKVVPQKKKRNVPPRRNRKR